MSSANEKKELLVEFNRPICDEMLKFLNERKGRLTKDMVSEFRNYVSSGVKSGPEFFLFTSLKILTSADISRYARRLSGEFYESFHHLGKEKLSLIIKGHIESSGA